MPKTIIEKLCEQINVLTSELSLIKRGNLRGLIKHLVIEEKRLFAEKIEIYSSQSKVKHFDGIIYIPKDEWGLFKKEEGIE